MPESAAAACNIGLQGGSPAEGGDVALSQPLPEQNVLNLAIATDLTSEVCPRASRWHTCCRNFTH